MSKTRSLRWVVTATVLAALLLVPAGAQAYPKTGRYYCYRYAEYSNVFFNLKRDHTYSLYGKRAAKYHGKWRYVRDRHLFVFASGPFHPDVWGRQHSFNGRWDPDGIDLHSRSNSRFLLNCFHSS